MGDTITMPPAKTQWVAGVDPGFDGAVALVGPDDTVAAIRMPTLGTGAARIIDIAAIVRFLLYHTYQPGVPTAIERVSARPGQGVASMFRFGRGTGQLIGWLQTLGVAWAHPTPAKWQKMLATDVGGKPKHAALAFVAMRFPRFAGLTPSGARKPHEGIADAICIAEWMRRNANG